MTRPPIQHGDTETRVQGFDAVLERLFERISKHARALGIGLGIFLALGVAAALLYDSARSAEEEAASALEAIEVQFAAAMGAPVGEPLPPEPANVEVARRAREAALEELELLIAEHEGSQAARIAGIRAAEMETDLGRLGAASERLQLLSERLDEDDPKRAVALRLAGYVLDEQGEPGAAAEAYARGGRGHHLSRSRHASHLSRGGVRARRRVSEGDRRLPAIALGGGRVPGSANRSAPPHRGPGVPGGPPWFKGR